MRWLSRRKVYFPLISNLTCATGSFFSLWASENKLSHFVMLLCCHQSYVHMFLRSINCLSTTYKGFIVKSCPYSQYILALIIIINSTMINTVTCKALLCLGYFIKMPERRHIMPRSIGNSQLFIEVAKFILRIRELQIYNKYFNVHFIR